MLFLRHENVSLSIGHILVLLLFMEIMESDLELSNLEKAPGNIQEATEQF